MSDLVFYLLLAVVGAVLGVLTLPWSNYPTIANDRPITWFITWALLWPYLLLFAAWMGIKAYFRAWGDYTSRKQEAQYAAQKQSPERGIPRFTAHQVVKETYFKKKP